MNVEILKTLVDRRKQLAADLNALKAQAAEHEKAIDALFEEKGQPLQEELNSVSRELSIELGLVDRAEADPKAEG